MADQGDAKSQNALGSLYAHGKGVKQDYEKAYTYFKKAMSKNVPEAINSIEFMYFNGFYFERDLKKVCEYYEKSANLDYGLGAAILLIVIMRVGDKR